MKHGATMSAIIFLLVALACCSPSLSLIPHSRLGKVSFSHLNRLQHLTSGAPSKSFGESLLQRRSEPYRDFLGLGVPEIGLALVAALVLFGPETMKSLSKDVGKAAAELKEIPKTFKEGMEEGAESAEVAKMKAIAAKKRKKRDEKLAAKAAAQSVEDDRATEDDDIDDDEE